MGHDDTERERRAERQKERQLVDVLDQNVGRLLSQRPPNGTPSQQRKAVSASHPRHIDPIERGPRRSSLPAGTDEADPMTSRRQAAEDLEQVDLGAAGVGVGPVLPIDQENVHE
jgi:hypothetical protein